MQHGNVKWRRGRKRGLKQRAKQRVTGRHGVMARQRRHQAAAMAGEIWQAGILRRHRWLGSIAGMADRKRHGK